MVGSFSKEGDERIAGISSSCQRGISSFPPSVINDGFLKSLSLFTSSQAAIKTDGQYLVTRGRLFGHGRISEIVAGHKETIQWRRANLNLVNCGMLIPMRPPRYICPLRWQQFPIYQTLAKRDNDMLEKLAQFPLMSLSTLTNCQILQVLGYRHETYPCSEYDHLI